MSERFGIEFLRGIAMRAPQMVETLGFYQEVWGLEAVHITEESAYLRGTGSEHYIYTLRNDPQFGIDYINFGMKDRGSLEGLYQQLCKECDQVESEPHDMDTPGGGYGFTLRDPDNRLLRVVTEVTEHTDSAEAYAMPSKVSHVVLNTIRLAEAESFYCDLLGFRRSDYYDARMSFLRCNTDHHSIGLFQNAHTSVNHVAFEMPDINSFMRGIGRMKQHNHVPSWGPGRHGPGNNPFAYFVSPSGYVIEFTTELQQIDEATHEVKEWIWGDPETGDRWMTAGAPTPAMRAVMLGRPDAGAQLRER
ncbi:MAG: VOC family protein [Granulosicoccus sp.]|nr:VOC family protein [Granulosicoccus sp.]